MPKLSFKKTGSEAIQFIDGRIKGLILFSRFQYKI